jgi:hypothetical protein
MGMFLPVMQICQYCNQHLHWHNEKKEQSISVSDRFKFCIHFLAECLGFKEKCQVTGYTTLKVYEKDCMQPVMYYAMECVSGSKTYDYAMVQLENKWWKSHYLPGQNNQFCSLQYDSGYSNSTFMLTVSGLGCKKFVL